MKKLCIAALLAVIVQPAAAADVATKAPSTPFQYPAADGFYFGVGTIGGGGSVNGVSAPGVNANSLTTNQIGVAGIAGYAWNVPNSSMFTAVEGWFGYNNFNGAAQGLSFSGPAMFKQRLLVGAPLADIAALFPTWGLSPPTFPVLPAGQAVASTKAYLGAVLNEDDITIAVAGAGSNRDWQFTPGITAGVLAQLTSGSVIDAFTEVKFGDRSICAGAGAGAACGKVGTTWLAGLALKW